MVAEMFRPRRWRKVGRSNHYWEDPNRHYRRDEAALAVSTETGQESSIEDPMEQFHVGHPLVIPSSLADIPCAVLGVQGVLDELNAILGTSHTLDTAPSSSTSSVSPSSPAPSFWIRLQKFATRTHYQHQHKEQQSPMPILEDSIERDHEQSLLSLLEDFIEKKYDFGTAYAYLRPVWNAKNPSEIRNELRRREKKDKERRRNALVGKRIVDMRLRPRRVWDLCSNRVVPSWVTEGVLIPISHAWVDEEDRVDVWTPINGKEWPVPMPKGADLNLIRIAMLSLGWRWPRAEYAWVDVLCLRQKGGPREHLRIPEWTLDVPTTGRVYDGAYTVVYLCGLGRPLRLKEGDLDSDRCWFRRAWTLHEVRGWYIIVGDIPDGPLDTSPRTPLLARLDKQLDSLRRRSLDIFATLAQMQTRISTNPVDRVAGLAFLLRTRAIPAYHESETLEDAWTALVNEVDSCMLTSLFFLYPGAGLGCKKWRPSWHQVMTEPLPEGNIFIPNVQHDDKTGEDWFCGSCIKKGLVHGLDVGSVQGGHRYGKLVVKAKFGIKRTFQICATHQFPIPNDTYTLIGNESKYWVIGRRLPDQTFEKVSVIMIDGDRDTWEKVVDLGSRVSRIVLV